MSVIIAASRWPIDGPVGCRGGEDAVNCRATDTGEQVHTVLAQADELRDRGGDRPEHVRLNGKPAYHRMPPSANCRTHVRFVQGFQCPLALLQFVLDRFSRAVRCHDHSGAYENFFLIEHPDHWIDPSD
jgi:hypothetical protein